MTRSHRLFGPRGAGRQPRGREFRCRVATRHVAQVLYGDEDAKAVGHELWDRWGQQLETLVEAAGVAPAGDVASWARFLRSLLWGVFNEAQLTGSLTDPADRRQRAKEMTKLLTPRLRARRRTARKG